MRAIFFEITISCALPRLPCPGPLHFPARRATSSFVADATKDIRFKDNTLVTGPPYIRFYCGVPLVTQDHFPLGSLCIIDSEPRVVSREDIQSLVNLAELNARELLATEVCRKFATKSGCAKDYEHLPASLPVSPPNVRELTGSFHARLPSLKKIRDARGAWFQQGLIEGVLVVDVTENRLEKYRLAKMGAAGSSLKTYAGEPRIGRERKGDVGDSPPERRVDQR